MEEEDLDKYPRPEQKNVENILKNLKKLNSVLSVMYLFIIFRFNLEIM
jgi:hypothetical protein